MSLVKYQLMISALENGTLTSAGNEMGYTQSGVSHMLNSLEKELGVQLIYRSRTGVRPTSAGELLLPYMKKIVSENTNMMQLLSEVTGNIRGRIAIGAFATISSFYLPDAIEKFQQQYPNVEFFLKIGSYEEIEYWMENGIVDCGFLTLPVHKNFKYIPVMSDRFVAVAAKGYPHKFKGCHTVTLEQLEGEYHVLLDGRSDYDVIRIFSDHITKLKVTVNVADAYAAMKMILKKRGIGIIPISLAQDFSDALDIYEIENNFQRTLALGYTDKKKIAPITKKFVEFIEAEAAENGIKAI